MARSVPATSTWVEKRANGATAAFTLTDHGGLTQESTLNDHHDPAELVSSLEGRTD